MGSIILTEKHYSSIIRNDVALICEPLKQYGITHFIYSRFFKDGTFYILTQNWDAYYHHYKNRYVISPPTPKESSVSRCYYLPTFHRESSQFNRAAYEWRSLFNIDNPIYFTEEYRDYLDFYSFASTANNASIVSFYLSNIDILEKFKFYFKDKARHLIAQSNKNKMMISGKAVSNFYATQVKSKGRLNKNQLLNELATQRYTFSLNRKEVSITDRELNVIRELAKGCSVKQAAKAMRISPRTIEHHLGNIREKLSLHRKTDIIDVISKVGLL